MSITHQQTNADPLPPSPLILAANWLYDFDPYSLVHAAVVVMTAATVTALVVVGRRCRDTQHSQRCDNLVAGVALLCWVMANGWSLLPRNLAVANSIPLHVSDVVGLCVPLALTVGWRLPRAIVYFWGFGLTTQAYISPTLTDGPATVAFWMFWLGHLAILAGAVYDIAVRHYRPTWPDFRLSLLALICYAAIIVPLNMLLNVNYGYLGEASPDQPTLLLYLGPWPLRLLPMTALATLALAIPMLAWVLLRRREERRA